MRSFLIILLTSLGFFLPGWQQVNVSVSQSATLGPFRHGEPAGDSSQFIRIVNASSLKRLPAVIRDLSLAFKGSFFEKEFSSRKNCFAIYLYDVTCNNFENSAAVRYQLNDTLYHLKLNRFNQYASDKALAVTLLHEIMHCLLLDINERARHEEKEAVSTIIRFGLNKNDSSLFFNNDFFALMNSGENGQHELIYQLFYPRMVALLKRFAAIHGESLPGRDAEHLTWSGLQQTNAYKELSDEEKEEIEN